VLVLIDGRLAADAPLKELTASHTMKLVTVGDADPRAALQSVAGVGEVKAAGSEGGGRAWSLRTTDGVQIGAAVLDACHRAGVRVEALSPETLTLETVFRRLQHEHAARQEVAA
jgi:hypothetical protein